MRVVIAVDDADLARRAAGEVAGAIRTAVAERGHATMAVSGGSTPGDLLEALANETLPWDRLHLFQVDERIAPAGHPDRNLELLRRRLLWSPPLVDADAEVCPQVHPMTVDDPHLDLDAAAGRYAARLRSYAGEPPVLDIVQLGLGTDGHTASLVPGDPVVDVVDRDVAVTGPYEGWRRMTLTAPTLARARSVLWLVRGADKREIVARLIAGDPALPASRIPHGRAVLFVDRASAPGPPTAPVPSR